MAKQSRNIILKGRADNLVFYVMEGKGYVRLKSSLTGRQFKRNKCFERSRQSAKRLAEASRIASRIYRNIPEKERSYVLFCLLKSKAIAMLKQGMGSNTAYAVLKKSTRGLKENENDNYKKFNGK